ncbi:MAG: lipocalin [Marinilabiliales bacterium]|nr:MAG: lipocalin [Marinilabiliales bacterium]
MRNIIFLSIAIIILNSCAGQKQMIDKTVVKDFDINKYLGKWYEIARFDHSFERGLLGVTANYSYRDDDKIKVVNAGYKGSLEGKRSEAIGKAKIPNPEIPSKLKVSFFWFFYGDYFVLELDKDYKWAIVGSSSDKYLWILSRTPHIEDVLYQQLLDVITKRGYDVSKLIKVKQKEKY